MDPFFARNRLSAYIDGALSDAEAADLADAIEADPALRAEYQAMKQAVDLLRTQGPTRAPAGFHARVVEAVREEPGPAGVVVQLRRLWNRVPLEAVALAAAAAVVVFVIQGRPDSESVDQEPDSIAEIARSERGEEAPAPLRKDNAGTPPPATTAPAAAPPAKDEGAGAVAPQAPEQAVPAARAQSEKKTQALEPYVAPYEQTGAASADGGLATSFGYRIQVDSAEVLFNLSSIAEQSGGQVRDSAGRPLEPRMLTQQDDYEQALLAVPRANAEAVRGHLEAMGGSAVAPPAAPSLFPADYAVFIIEVRFSN